MAEVILVKPTGPLLALTLALGLLACKAETPAPRPDTAQEPAAAADAPAAAAHRVIYYELSKG